MSLQFIFGNSGSGKSHYLYESIIEESIRKPEWNYLVLVPEQFTMQTQKDLCEMHPRGGIMNIDVLSFVRLSHRIFEEVGQEISRVLDDEGKNLILRKIAAMHQEDLPILKGNLKKQGYISEVKSVISEFTQYGVGFDTLDSFIETLNPESYLAYKLRDIRTIYEGFEDYLAEKYITKEEMLDRLSDVVPQSLLLKNSVIVLDGFTGFTPVQNRLLGTLMKVCRKIVITVEMDEREDPFVYKHPYQLFAISKQMVSSLVRIAKEEDVAIEQSVYLYEQPVKRFAGNPAMAFLEQELFRNSGKIYEETQNVISIHETKNPKEEAEFIAGEVRRLIREKGFRLKDIGVIVSDMNVYAAHFERAFTEYEIPVFMDYKKSILLNAFVEYLRSLLAMAEQKFSYESVFRFLRTGMTGFSFDEIDCLENYVIASGIKGYKKWQEAWVRRTSGVKEEDLTFLNNIRVRFVEKIDGLMFVLKKRNKTVRDITAAIHDFFVQEKMQEKIQFMAEKFQAEGELAMAKEYSQVYRIVIELFDKFVELLGDERISMSEYCELLDAGLEEAKVGVIPPGMDQVVIGDMERTRLNNLKALFFAGANDAYLPGNLSKGGLLNERDREYFAKGKIELSPGAKEKAYVQKFYLYMNLTKPSQYLYLTFSKMTYDGKGLRAVYLVQDFKRLYPDLTIHDEEHRTLLGREITRKNGTEFLAKGLSEKSRGLNDEWKELYTWLKKEGTQEEALKKMLTAAFYSKRKEKVTKETAYELFGDTKRFSITRLEQYASCAYAHFLSYGLRLSEREIYQFEAVDLGNIAHQSIERFAKKADRMNLEWTQLTEDQREEMIDQSVEESILEYGNTVLYSTSRDEYMITRIKHLIRRSVWALTKQMEKSDFRPAGYEMKFGSGKIDRIDTCEDEKGVYVKVTDYKTGMKAFDITSFYHGLQMQLPVYLNAAVELEKKRHKGQEVIPAGMFYYRMQDPIVNKEKDEEKLEKSILKELKLDGLINAQEEVLEHMEKGLKEESVLIPLGRTKSGALSRYSKVLSPEEFGLFLDYAKKKSDELCSQIADGDADIAPYELGNATGCDYCNYRSICGFDTRLPGFQYRSLKKYSREEVMERIRQEMESANEKNESGSDNKNGRNNSGEDD